MPEEQVHEMTIEKATALYEEYGSSLQSEIDQWIEFVQRAKIESPLSNGNYFHALQLTEGMLRRTCYRFLMLTGQGADNFVRSLRDAVRGMMRRIDANQGDARIIIANGKGDELRELAAEFPRTLLVREVSITDGPISHFIVGDYDMVRQEEPHPPLEGKMLADVIKASMYFANPTKVRLFTEWFNKGWEQIGPTAGPAPYVTV
jgi:hypothetical protein